MGVRRAVARTLARAPFAGMALRTVVPTPPGG